MKGRKASIAALDKEEKALKRKASVFDRLRKPKIGESVVVPES